MNTGIAVLKLNEVESTNDFAKQLLLKNNLPPFYVILTDKQIKGRGQKENSWHSEVGKNLLFSIITYPTFLLPTEQFYLSKAISLGIIDYLNSKKRGFKIKWPNDIYYYDKKICGILIENSISGLTIKNSIIGIGLNLNQKKFPEYLPNAISLSNILKKELFLTIEFESVINFISNKYSELKNKDFEKIDQLYHNNLYRFNIISNFKDVNGIFKGKIIETLPEGKLIIETLENEIRAYNFKEVEFLSNQL